MGANRLRAQDLTVWHGGVEPHPDTYNDSEHGPARGSEGLSTRVARIVAAVELDIVLGRLHPRERLTEQAIAQRFSTNRATVRVAFAELERRGLITRPRNVGATVVDFRPAEVEQIYAVRELLETAAARQIQYPVSPDILERLREIQQCHGDAVDRQDLQTVFRENIRFHRELFAICGNRVLVETIESLAQRSYAIRSYSHTDPQYLAAAREDHRAMIEALASGDRDRLVELCRRHLVPSREAYIRAYRRRFPHEE